jgi:hypothetical protein
LPDYGKAGSKGDWVSSRLTAHISARALTCQHAGAHDYLGHGASSPAAKHFMVIGALHVFVRRRAHFFEYDHCDELFLKTKAKRLFGSSRIE